MFFVHKPFRISWLRSSNRIFGERRSLGLAKGPRKPRGKGPGLGPDEQQHMHDLKSSPSYCILIYRYMVPGTMNFLQLLCLMMVTPLYAVRGTLALISSMKPKRCI
jgi:hypothetical protein